jgi:hypothetical protein
MGIKLAAIIGILRLIAENYLILTSMNRYILRREFYRFHKLV